MKYLVGIVAVLTAAFGFLFGKKRGQAKAEETAREYSQRTASLEAENRIAKAEKELTVAAAELTTSHTEGNNKAFKARLDGAKTFNDVLDVVNEMMEDSKNR